MAKGRNLEGQQKNINLKINIMRTFFKYPFLTLLIIIIGISICFLIALIYSNILPLALFVGTTTIIFVLASLFEDVTF